MIKTTDFDNMISHYSWLEERCGRGFKHYIDDKPNKFFYPDVQPGDKIMTVGEGNYRSNYYFRDGRLIDHWVSE